MNTNGNYPPRVVITGLGAITPLGLDLNTTWQALLAGTSGINYLTKIDTGDLRVNFAGEIRDFDPGQYLDRKAAARWTSRSSMRWWLRSRPWETPASTSPSRTPPASAWSSAAALAGMISFVEGCKVAEHAACVRSAPS